MTISEVVWTRKRQKGGSKADMDKVQIYSISAYSQSVAKLGSKLRFLTACRARETAELRDRLDKECGDLRDRLAKEIQERQV